MLLFSLSISRCSSLPLLFQRIVFIALSFHIYITHVILSFFLVRHSFHVSSFKKHDIEGSLHLHSQKHTIEMILCREKKQRFRVVLSEEIACSTCNNVNLFLDFCLPLTTSLHCIFSLPTKV